MAPADGQTTSAGLVVTSVFTLHDPADQDRLYQLLDRNAVDILQHTSGFLGSTLSRSDDHTTLVHHSRWRDDAAAHAMLRNPAAQASVTLTRQLADIKVIRANTNTHYRSATRSANSPTS